MEPPTGQVLALNTAFIPPRESLRLMPLAPVVVEVHAFVLPGVQNWVSPPDVADALSIGTTHFTNVTWGRENTFCQRLGLERLVITTGMQDNEPVSYFRVQLQVFVSQFRVDEPHSAMLEDADETPMALFTSTSLPRKALDGKVVESISPLISSNNRSSTPRASSVQKTSTELRAW